MTPSGPCWVPRARAAPAWPRREGCVAASAPLFALSLPLPSLSDAGPACLCRGESFHFAHRFKGETLRESITRHEHFLALQLKLTKGQKVLDVGCGVGGPLRAISAFSGAAVTGVNNNAYQISRGEKLNAATGHHDHCRFVKADFMSLAALGAGTFDAAYQIEATCHAPDIRGCLAQIYAALKPGGHFGSYEWCLTDAYDESNPEHRQYKHDILLGNGLPDLRTCAECEQAMRDVGFEVLVAEDIAASSEVPWYKPIDASAFISLSSFRTCRLGRALTHYAVYVLETLRIAPKGSVSVSSFLVKGADALVAGGRHALFTPMFFTLCRKPLAGGGPAPSASLHTRAGAAPAEAGEEVQTRATKSPGPRTRKASQA